jgi:ArsR family transcriptional regulator, arsenate/arsenite/antimonite-responsive transcriptional repressor
MKSRSATAALDLLFRALADPTRLRLLNLIADREICVCYLVEILRMSQPKVSRHLAYLRRAGIVASRREGKWMHYRLAMPKDEIAARILQETLRHLREKQEMKRDVSRLGDACCTPGKFQVPAAAPAPVLAARALGAGRTGSGRTKADPSPHLNSRDIVLTRERRSRSGARVGTPGRLPA